MQKKKYPVQQKEMKDILKGKKALNYGLNNLVLLQNRPIHRHRLNQSGTLPKKNQILPMLFACALTTLGWADKK